MIPIMQDIAISIKWMDKLTMSNKIVRKVYSVFTPLLYGILGDLIDIFYARENCSGYNCDFTVKGL